MITRQNALTGIFKRLPERASQDVLDTLSENIAVLDAKGVITAVNSSWKRFPSENGGNALDRGAIGENYIRGFKDAFGGDAKFVRAGREMGSVLTGKKERFSIEYPCHRKHQKRWFRLTVTPLRKRGALSGIVVSHADVTRRKLAEIQTRRLAVIDPMTGIMNRKSGLEYLKKQIKNCRRRKRSLTLCYIDLDNLKFVNDNYGHSEGDKTIRSAVKMLKKVLRPSDTICRLGGDEILLVLPGNTTDESRPVVERIMEKIALRNEKSRIPWKMDFSYGLAEYTPGRKCSADELVDTADRDMYVMKISKRYKKGVN